MTEHAATTTGRGGRAPMVRTWQPEPAAPPPPAQVQDPAVRAILRTVSRALQMISAEIDRRMLHTPGSATFKKDTARRRKEYEDELRATGRGR